MVGRFAPFNSFIWLSGMRNQRSLNVWRSRRSISTHFTASRTDSGLAAGAIQKPCTKLRAYFGSHRRTSPGIQRLRQAENRKEI